MPSVSQIELYRMPQLAEAIKTDDDWTGVTDAAQRRKRQNRLNVRAYRRRKAQQLQVGLAPTTNEPSLPCWIESQQQVLYLSNALARAARRAQRPLLPMTETPTKIDQVILPLSSDHLILLLQYNVLRGCLFIRELLSTCFEAPDDASTLHTFPAVDSIKALPPSLQPTQLQLTTPHPHWIDIIPHPGLRDNLILASGSFDEDDLWTDTWGALFEGSTCTNAELEQNGVVMWNPPCHISGWEFSKGFCRKWGWMMRDCDDIVEATNAWRRRRGEEDIVLDIESIA